MFLVFNGRGWVTPLRLKHLSSAADSLCLLWMFSVLGSVDFSGKISWEPALFALTGPFNKFHEVSWLSITPLHAAWACWTQRRRVHTRSRALWFWVGMFSPFKPGCFRFKKLYCLFVISNYDWKENGWVRLNSFLWQVTLEVQLFLIKHSLRYLCSGEKKSLAQHETTGRTNSKVLWMGLRGIIWVSCFEMP